MATISLRSGGALGRRLLPCAAISAVDATAAAAPCHRQVHSLSPLSGATPARPTSLPYLPRVDIATPVILFSQFQSPSSSSLTYEAQVDGATPAMIRRLDSLTDGARTTSGSSSAPHERQAETATCVLRHRHLCTCISVSGVRPAIASLTSARYDPQTYAGAATSFHRMMSSAALPCDGAPGKGIPTGSAAHTDDGEKASTESAALNFDACKYDEGVVLNRLDRIDAKVGNVETKVDGIDAKVREAIADCAKFSKDVELLKKQQEGSGDWTSFKIKGRNLNWLSVGSAAWDMIKAYFK